MGAGNLEQIVRPYQTVDVAPPRRYVAAGDAGVPPVLLQVGRGGAGKVFNGSYSATVSYYADKHVNERVA